MESLYVLSLAKMNDLFLEELLQDIAKTEMLSNRAFSANADIWAILRTWITGSSNLPEKSREQRLALALQVVARREGAKLQGSEAFACRTDRAANPFGGTSVLDRLYEEGWNEGWDQEHLKFQLEMWHDGGSPIRFTAEAALSLEDIRSSQPDAIPAFEGLFETVRLSCVERPVSGIRSARVDENRDAVISYRKETHAVLDNVALQPAQRCLDL